MNKRNMELLGGSLAGVMLLSGGAAVVAANHDPTPETAAKPTTVPGTEFPEMTNTASSEVTTPSPTELPTEALVTATDEVTAFTAEKLAFVPHSVEEIGQSVEVRSPIDDPEGYKEDIQKVLDVIHTQILPNYSGEFIRGDKQQVGVQTDRGVIVFQMGASLNPIASVYFNWTDSNGNAYKVPRYFFPAEDSEGKFTISITFDPVRENPPGYVSRDNPAPNWEMSALLTKFPMQLVDNGSFEASYIIFPRGDDEFATTYFQHRKSLVADGDNIFEQSFFNFIGHKSFDRKCEVLSLVSLGGQ